MRDNLKPYPTEPTYLWSGSVPDLGRPAHENRRVLRIATYEGLPKCSRLNRMLK